MSGMPKKGGLQSESNSSTQVEDHQSTPKQNHSNPKASEMMIFWVDQTLVPEMIGIGALENQHTRD